MPGRELDHLYCVHCGTKNRIEEKKEGPGLKSCSKCKRQPVTAMALLTDVGLTGLEYGRCSKCEHANLMLHTYCFNCGAEWRKA
jgi:formate dehydrogenase maturation protein FdhE